MINSRKFYILHQWDMSRCRDQCPSNQFLVSKHRTAHIPTEVRPHFRNQLRSLVGSALSCSLPQGEDSYRIRIYSQCCSRQSPNGRRTSCCGNNWSVLGFVVGKKNVDLRYDPGLQFLPIHHYHVWKICVWFRRVENICVSRGCFCTSKLHSKCGLFLSKELGSIHIP